MLVLLGRILLEALANIRTSDDDENIDVRVRLGDRGNRVVVGDVERGGLGLIARFAQGPRLGFELRKADKKLSMERAARMVPAPAAAVAWAIAKPIPRLAPAMRAFFPDSENIDSSVIRYSLPAIRPIYEEPC